MLDGNTEIKLEVYQGSPEDCQRLCRSYEGRAFEVLGVSWSAGIGYLITLRVPKMLYVNYVADTPFTDGDTISISYQAGPYRGHEEAEQAERGVIMSVGLDKVRDSYVTGLRDHSRNFVGSHHV